MPQKLRVQPSVGEAAADSLTVVWSGGLTADAMKDVSHFSLPDLKKLGALQRKFDDKELELHDHLDLSTACRFHLHIGLAQVAIGKDGKQHLDEAKKLADELADHDLIWLCDKHTRARASLEC